MRKSLNTKEKILRASLELFTNRGYVATTTKEIAEAASISEVTLFRHFEAKERIFQAIIEKTLPIIVEELKEVQLRTEEPFYSAIPSYCVHLYNVIRKHQAIIMLTIQTPRQYPVNSEAFLSIPVLLKESLRSALIYFYEKGEIEEQEWHSVSRGLASLLFGGFLMDSHFSQQYNFETTQELRTMIQSFIAGWRVS